MRNNIILVSAAVVMFGLGALFVVHTDSEVQAQAQGQSPAWAECLLNNLKNADSDGAASLLLKACNVLAP